MIALATACPAASRAGASVSSGAAARVALSPSSDALPGPGDDLHCGVAEETDRTHRRAITRAQWRVGPGAEREVHTRVRKRDAFDPADLEATEEHQRTFLEPRRSRQLGQDDSIVMLAAGASRKEDREDEEVVS